MSEDEAGDASQPAGWRFRPRLLHLLALLVFLPALLSLGLWQLNRAEQKRALHERMVRAEAAVPVTIQDWQPLAGLPDWTRVRLQGEFVAGQDILLDNQLHRGQPGYHVFTPLQDIEGGRVLLVNRGWVASGLDRRFAPQLASAPPGRILLSGTLKPFPFSGIRLRELPPEQLAGGVYRVHSLQRHALETQLGRGMFPQVLRLDAESPGGYLRAWAPPSRIGAERSIAYAWQYFAMALVVLGVFLALSVQRRDNGEREHSDPTD